MDKKPKPKPKKTYLALAILSLVLVAFPLLAFEEVDVKDQVMGGKLDAPNLVRIMPNVYFGVEGSKDLRLTSFEEGWTGMAKITWTRTLLDFAKDK